MEYVWIVRCRNDDGDETVDVCGSAERVDALIEEFREGDFEGYYMASPWNNFWLVWNTENTWEEVLDLGLWKWMIDIKKMEVLQ
jgi:hypothetical protein